jgi:hypothetical protein
MAKGDNNHNQGKDGDAVPQMCDISLWLRAKNQNTSKPYLKSLTMQCNQENNLIQTDQSELSILKYTSSTPTNLTLKST